jgi:hypothetical protein
MLAREGSNIFYYEQIIYLVSKNEPLLNIQVHSLHKKFVKIINMSTTASPVDISKSTWRICKKKTKNESQHMPAKQWY